MHLDHWSWQEFSHSSLQLKKGDSLFRQGESIENMYLLASGRVKLTRFTPDGSTTILHIANAGEMIAEASLFATEYHCTANIDRNADLLQIKRDIILAELKDNPDRSLALLQHMSRQVRDLRGLMEVRNIRSAQARILAHLNSIADTDGQVRLGASRRDIAYSLGLAPETFYRELSKLLQQQRIRQLDEKTLIISG